MTFDKVITSGVKVVIKDGYLGEPTFYEITPGLESSEIEIPIHTEKIEEILELAKYIDKNDLHYINADELLKEAFDIAVKDASEYKQLTQAEIDSLEYFLRSRYDRFAFGSILFEDVPKDAYYAASVKWAVENKITSGMTASMFGPDLDCSRSQVVTFLWRAAGRPKASIEESTFKDVQKGAYYYDAVLWAVENNITSGYNAEVFGTEDKVTRCQFVTFLWRLKNRPEPLKLETDFVDIDTNAYYYKAVLWAVENKVTAGYYQNYFAPDNSCSRAQIVTFLYRSKDV